MSERVRSTAVEVGSRLPGSTLEQRSGTQDAALAQLPNRTRATCETRGRRYNLTKDIISAGQALHTATPKPQPSTTPSSALPKGGEHEGGGGGGEDGERDGGDDDDKEEVAMIERQQRPARGTPLASISIHLFTKYAWPDEILHTKRTLRLSIGQHGESIATTVALQG